MTISGYAAVFYDGTPETEYRLGEDMVERIEHGAFDAVLRDGDDVVSLFNHNNDNLLGRVASGTVRLSVDRRGLKYDVETADTELHNRVEVLQSRGDLVGSSMGFWPTKQRYEKPAKRGGDTVRRIKEARLYDVGPVTNPAYVGTNMRNGYAARCTFAGGNELRALPTNNPIEQRSAADAARLYFIFDRWLER